MHKQLELVIVRFELIQIHLLRYHTLVHFLRLLAVQLAFIIEIESLLLKLVLIVIKVYFISFL